MLPSARCAGQVHPRIAFALSLKSGSVEAQDFSGNTAPGTVGEEMGLEKGPGSPSCLGVLKAVLCPHQTCLVFELSGAFGAGISHSPWAGGLCVPAHAVRPEVFQEKIPVRD